MLSANLLSELHQSVMSVTVPVPFHFLWSDIRVLIIDSWLQEKVLLVCAVLGHSG